MAERTPNVSTGSDLVGAALSFYKALKVYPEPQQLIEIYDNTVAKDILGVLAVMCAQDKELNRKIGGSRAGSDAGQVE
jgi:mitochondrial import receptor subunit TOM20